MDDKGNAIIKFRIKIGGDDLPMPKKTDKIKESE